MQQLVGLVVLSLIAIAVCKPTTVQSKLQWYSSVTQWTEVAEYKMRCTTNNHTSPSWCIYFGDDANVVTGVAYVMGFELKKQPTANFVGLNVTFTEMNSNLWSKMPATYRVYVTKRSKPLPATAKPETWDCMNKLPPVGNKTCNLEDACDKCLGVCDLAIWEQDFKIEKLGSVLINITEGYNKLPSKSVFTVSISSHDVCWPGHNTYACGPDCHTMSNTECLKANPRYGPSCPANFRPATAADSSMNGQGSMLPYLLFQ